MSVDTEINLTNTETAARMASDATASGDLIGAGLAMDARDLDDNLAKMEALKQHLAQQPEGQGVQSAPASVELWTSDDPHGMFQYIGEKLVKPRRETINDGGIRHSIITGQNPIKEWYEPRTNATLVLSETTDNGSEAQTTLTAHATMPPALQEKLDAVTANGSLLISNPPK
jgi:hypothetical protein